MTRGWVVLVAGSEFDPIECKTKKQAEAKAKQFIKKGYDGMIASFDENNPDGCMANSKTIEFKNIK